MNKQKKEKKFYHKLIPVMACLAVATTIVVYPMINNRNAAVDPNSGITSPSQKYDPKIHGLFYTGKVIEIDGEKVTIKTEDNKNVKLYLSDDSIFVFGEKSDLKVGEIIEFRTKPVTDNDKMIIHEVQFEKKNTSISVNDINNLPNATEDNIVINESEGNISSAKLYFDPSTTYSVEMTQEEYVDYLGRDPRPSYLPEGLSEDSNKYYSIIKNNDGSAAYDNGGFNYSTTDNSSDIRIITAKDKLPTRDCLYLTDSENTSTINGVKVYLSHSNKIYSLNNIENKYGMYFATFIYEGIGYDIEFTNVSQDEVIKVIKSFVQPIS